MFDVQDGPGVIHVVPLVLELVLNAPNLHTFFVHIDIIQIKEGTKTDKQIVRQTEAGRQTETDKDRRRLTKTGGGRHRKRQTNTDRRKLTKTDGGRHRERETYTDGD